MAASSNESQGLKIAVAVFIALSVILSVTCYFLYSSYAQADAQRAKAVEGESTARKAQGMLQAQVEDLRGRIGVRAEDADAAKAEIDAHYKKIYGQLDELDNKVAASLQKFQQSGAQPAELEDLRAKVQQAIQSFRQENKRTYISSLDRLTELMENLSLLATVMGGDYLDLRHALESATTVNNKQLAVQTGQAETARNDVMEEQKKHVEERGSLLAKVETLTKDNDLKTTEIANLNEQVRRLKEEHDKERGLLTTQIRDWRDKAERSDVVLDHPDGYVTYVDYESREVQVNVNRQMGARPQMVLAIFDARSPGVPTEKPKGTIQLTKVGDLYSVARIVKMNNPIEPIRTGDIVYSAAWSPNSPTHFAFMGKIDVNRDGRDDRAELKRMIEDAGGVVDYDLPPPWLGKETGKLSPQIDWYVTDDRMPFRDVYNPSSEPMLKLESELKERMGKVIQEARLVGIRPIPIGKLLNYLGYDINTPIFGKTEAVNDAAIKRLVSPKRRENAAAPAADANAPAGNANAPADNAGASETPKKDDQAGDQ